MPQRVGTREHYNNVIDMETRRYFGLMGRTSLATIVHVNLMHVWLSGCPQ